MSAASNREETFFEQALGIDTPEARDVFLREGCGDDTAMLARLQGLLGAHDRAGGFLEHKPAAPGAPSPAAAALGVPPSGGPAGEPAEAGTPNPDPSEKPGDRIGRYKLLEQIGEGGMGTVWMAEQEEPVRRRVALKVIKLGMDTRQVLARFEAERQALALMDHPNIARVFDGGATGSAESEISNLKSEIPRGRPYFVMELVRGLPITKYCDEARLSTRDRLELFGQVCRAVQHAHQKGIIHRDLKPSNILVTVQDDRPVVKVIDFGIAKATEGRLTEKTLFTGFQQLIGTPAYMSPEQASLGSLDIDTRSDTYSLGVVLYELLTGRPPFDTKELLKSGYEAVLRTIRETEPVKPSTRLKQERSARPVVAAKSEIGNRKSEIDNDLDWIVMKCLEKDRARRYETANGLATDIERYLHDEPVQARPPSALYRWQKIARKHRAAVTAAAGFLVLLATAAIVSTALALWANRERESARDSEAETKAVLQFLRGKVLAATRPEGQEGGLGREATIRAAIAAAEPEIARLFAGRPLVEASIRHTLGDTYAYLGDHPVSLRQHERAWELFNANLGPDRPETLDAAHAAAVNYNELGMAERAVPIFEDTLRRRRAVLGPHAEGTIWTLCALGSACRACGRLNQAVRLLEESLALLQTYHPSNQALRFSAMNHLAEAYHLAGRAEKAGPLLEAVVREWEAMPGRDNPDTVWAINNVVRLHLDRGRPDLAAPIIGAALNFAREKLGPDNPTTLILMNTRGWVQFKLGDVTNALISLREALRLTEAVRGPEHPDTAGSLNYNALVTFSMGQIDQAAALFDRVLRIRRKTLPPDHPDTLGSINDLAIVYMRTGRATNAVPLLEEARAKRLARLGPNHPSTLKTLNSLALAYAAAGRLDDGLRVFEDGQALPKGKPNSEDSDALATITGLAQACREAGRLDKAVAFFQQAIRLRTEKPGSDGAEVAHWQAQLAECYLRQGNPSEAESLLHRALPILEAQKAGLSPSFNAQSLLGWALLARKEFTEAERLLLKAHEGLTQRDAQRPSRSHAQLLNDTAERLVQLYEATGNSEEAAEWRSKLKALAAPRPAAVP